MTDQSGGMFAGAAKADRPRGVGKGFTGVSVSANVLLLAVLAMVGLAVVATAAAGSNRRQVLDGLTVSNTIIGLSLALAGWPIARHRPDNRLGWLLLYGGACYVASGAGYPLLAAATAPGEDSVAWQLVATVTNGAWPWVVSLFLPLILLVFPDGRLLNRRWRWVVAVDVIAAALFEASSLFAADTYANELGVRGYLRWTVYDQLQDGADTITTVIGLGVYAAAIFSLVLRYRRGDEKTRRQILWLLWGSSIMVVAFTIDNVVEIDWWLSIFPITLVPLSIAVAVLRHQLLDIRLVVSRSVLYIVLTAGVVGAYVGLVAALDATLRREVGVGTSVLATLLIAGVFHPVRIWLQRRVDEVFYGARRDPMRAMSELGVRLGEVSPDTATGLAGVLEGLCTVMRLPSAAITVDGREVACHGRPPPLRQTLDLRQGGELIGELTVGLRSGESRLDPADEKVLALLSTSLAVAMRATSLAGQLGRAREALVTTREEERQRLRRDLHDGLGPALTAVTLQADAARRLVRTQPEQAEALMVELRTLATATTGNVRRLVNELRPSALDGLGLVGALREQATSLSRRGDGSSLRITVNAAQPLPDLPPAVEVAAYRIATEALNNVTRHSTASTATVSLTGDEAALTLMIHDNGQGNATPWQPGIGLTSMRERAAELGGSCDIGADAGGGRITVTLPLDAHR